MLNEKIIKRINEVETKSEYDELMDNFKYSKAPLKLRQEAMDELKKIHSIFDDEGRKHTTPKEVLQMIKEGEADISDLCNGY